MSNDTTNKKPRYVTKRVPFYADPDFWLNDMKGYELIGSMPLDNGNLVIMELIETPKPDPVPGFGNSDELLNACKEARTWAAYLPDPESEKVWNVLNVAITNEEGRHSK